MKKILIVATVVKLHINVFHIPHLEHLKKKGYEVHVCAKNDYVPKENCIIPYCDKFYNLPFERFPAHPNNIKTYQKLKKIIDDNNYDIIHCHTPVGGALTRLAAKDARKKGTKVYYTAHGFHFYKGSSLKNWLLYYPLEKHLSRYTDVLITLNKEDFILSDKNMLSKQSLYVPGVGIDLKKFKSKLSSEISKENDFDNESNTFVLVSTGEINTNKNHKVVLKSISNLKHLNIKYIICGEGPLTEKLIEYSKSLGIESKVEFKGYVKNISEILQKADLFVFPSFREGLSLSLMEAMSAGLPVIASNIRGNSDLIDQDKGGFLFNPQNPDELTKLIEKLAENKILCSEFSKYNLKKIKEYSVEKVIYEMTSLY